MTIFIVNTLNCIMDKEQNPLFSQEFSINMDLLGLFYLSLQFSSCRQFGPGAVALQYQQSSSMILYLTAMPGTYQFVFIYIYVMCRGPFNTSINMTVQLIDVNNATHFTNVNITVFINNSCTILPPKLSISPSANYVPVGQSRSKLNTYNSLLKYTNQLFLIQ